MQKEFKQGNVAQCCPIYTRKRHSCGIIQSLNIFDKHGFIDDIGGMAVAATKYLKLLKKKDKPEDSFIMKQASFT